MISAEDCEAIGRGKHNCFIGHGERGGLIFTCDKCKGEHVILEPQPLWVVESLAWEVAKNWGGGE